VVFPRNIKDKVVEFPHRYKLTSVSGQANTYDLTPEPGVITDAGTAINKGYLQPIEQELYERSYLYADSIKGSTQTPTIIGGQITQIVHKIGANTVRTDTFAYTSTLITEVRTLPTGEVLTLKYYFNADGSYNRTEVS